MSKVVEPHWEEGQLGWYVAQHAAGALLRELGMRAVLQVSTHQ